jgi:Fur family peroxide stress response transcriptional regulator
MSEKPIDDFIQEFKSRGLHVTYPRLAIYKILLDYQGHPSAEDIYKEVQKEYPNISLATVYKTMEMLAEHDLISKVTPLHDIARYDCNSEYHHHLVCVKCKAIIDIDSNSVDQIKIPKSIEKEFKILNYRIQIDGICKNCQN